MKIKLHLTTALKSVKDYSSSVSTLHRDGPAVATDFTLRILLCVISDALGD